MKKLLSLLMATIMIACLLPSTAFAHEDYGIIVSTGYCGIDSNPESVKWTRYDSGTLVFSGQGPMRDYYNDWDNQYLSGYCKYTPVIDDDVIIYHEFDTKRIIIEEGVTRIGISAFSSFYNLKSIEISNTVKSIGTNAFFDCAYLESINIPEGTTEIDSYAFEKCKSLKYVSLPSTLKSIGSAAFSQCSRLSVNELPKNLETIGDYAFSQTLTHDLYLPSSIKKIGVCPVISPCFRSYSIDEQNKNYCVDRYGVLFTKDKKSIVSCPMALDLISYTIPDGVTTIEPLAFNNVINIQHIIMPNSVLNIEQEAFMQCLSLKTIQFSKRLEAIKDSAFAGCIFIDNIVIPSSVKKIGESAFNACVMLSNFMVNGFETEFCNESVGYLYDQPAKGFSKQDIAEKYKAAVLASLFGDSEEAKRLTNDYDNSCVFAEGSQLTKDTCTIKCHSGSTAEEYAKENGVNYETVHFFVDWSYDWENLTRERKCNLCDKIETESLDKSEIDNVEVIKPTDPNTDFDVEEVTKSNNKYILVQDIINGKGEIVKVFDIKLKNKDGVNVQPNGTVKVKIPHNWKHNNYKVYRINDDGTYTDMNAYRQGSHIVFETDHFSLYVIVDESPSVPSTPDDDNKAPLDFINKIINSFKALIYKIKIFFRSIGDRT